MTLTQALWSNSAMTRGGCWIEKPGPHGDVAGHWTSIIGGSGDQGKDDVNYDLLSII